MGCPALPARETFDGPVGQLHAKTGAAAVAAAPQGGMPPSSPAPPPNAAPVGGAGVAPFDIVGTYTLQRANGAKVPMAFGLTSGSLEIKPDRSWLLRFGRMSSLPGAGGFVFFGEDGTLTRTGSVVHFHSSAGSAHPDFDGVASGCGTLMIDYYVGSADTVPRHLAFVKDGVDEDPRKAPTPARQPPDTAPR
jgi:hypothetical protein